MNIFLTGATGTIGSAVLSRSLAAGHGVTALTRSDAAARAVTAAGATAHPGDIANPEAWMAKAVAADCFVHLANTFDASMGETEPRLLASLFAKTARRPVPLRFLYTGGCWLYGETGMEPADEDTPLNPIHAFQWAADAIAELGDHAGLSTAVLHPAMVYHQGGGSFSRMLRAVRAGRAAPIWGSDRICWPLIHRDDAADAYLALAQDRDATGPFNIVAQPRVPIGDIAAHIHAQAGIRSKPAILPRKYVRAQHGAMAEGPMLNQSMVSRRMGRIDWTPRHLDFTQLAYDI